MKDDIDLYGNHNPNPKGLPDYYGWEHWICIDNQPEFIANPCDFIVFSKPVHHYSRFDRFRMVTNEC